MQNWPNHCLLTMPTPVQLDLALANKGEGA
jgi:hypothetical protein